MKKIFVRICSKSEPLDVPAIRDTIYLQRYGATFESDIHDRTNASRAFAFESRELTVMDNCLFVYLTSDEIEKLKQRNFVVEGFQMFKWVAL